MVLITCSKLPLKVVGVVNHKLIVLLYFFSMWVAHGLHNDSSLRWLAATNTQQHEHTLTNQIYSITTGGDWSSLLHRLHSTHQCCSGGGE